MPVTAPFLYPQQPKSQLFPTDPYDGFDPKAVSRASWTPTVPKAKNDGPLMDFNRHPDSYLIVPYGNTDAKPMDPKVKKTIKTVRWIQFTIRLAQFLGALGLLVCVICIKNTQGGDGYIIRVPAAVDIVTTAYAIYHLKRPAKGRTPISSASYHFFAFVIDVCLIPFYVFTILLARSEQNLATRNESRWTSFFNSQGTDKIILSTWLISLAVGGLHLVTAVISIYLVYIFRKIARLPPDMNPLEDNLTSRRKTKHKYKNSEVSASDISEPTLVGSTMSFAESSRSSPIKQLAMADVRPVPFLHTRTNSDHSYSPHNPISAEMSRSHVAILPTYSMYSQPYSARESRMDVLQADYTLAVSESHSKRSHGFMSEPSSHDPPLSASSSVYSRTSTMTSTPPLPRKSSRRHALMSDNWFVHDRNSKENNDPRVSIVEEDDEQEDVKATNRPYEFRGLTTLGRTYQPVAQEQEDVSWSPQHQNTSRESFVPVPLGMNPPTPPPEHTYAGRNTHSSKPLSNMSGNTGRGTGSSPKKSVGTPTKVKYYGDLNSAMAGVRGVSPIPSPRNDKTGRTERMDWAAQDGGKKGRIVSRTGADEGRELQGEVRGRGVSGKVAEEGRGGVGWRGWGR